MSAVMLPVVFGDYSGEAHVTLCRRTDERRVTHEMWYAGNIVHDGVSGIRHDDGSPIQVTFPPDGYEKGIPSPWDEDDEDGSWGW